MSLLNVEDVTHMYGDKTLFKNINFRLLPGEHAGLVGSNGAGKSTLLRILAGDLLPDAGKVEWFPHVNTGYLRQHMDKPPGITLSDYLRSAFTHLYEIEHNMLQLAADMSDTDKNLEQLLMQYGELQYKLEHSDFYQIDAKVEEVAAGLGLLQLSMDRHVEELSGGQRTKLMLGKLLLEQPHVLLLDEPTNYLDDSHIDWLIYYLKNYEHAFLVVSHNEHFLNEITKVIYHLEHQTIKRYPGNYQTFLRNLRAKQIPASGGL